MLFKRGLRRNPSCRLSVNISEHLGMSPSEWAIFSSSSEVAIVFVEAQARMFVLRNFHVCSARFCRKDVFFFKKKWFRPTSAFRFPQPGQPDWPDSGDPPTVQDNGVLFFCENHAVFVGCPVMWGAFAVHRAPHSCVDGLLTTAEKRKAINHHFQSVVVGGKHRKVQEALNVFGGGSDKTMWPFPNRLTRFNGARILTLVCVTGFHGIGSVRGWHLWRHPFFNFCCFDSCVDLIFVWG